MSKRTQLLSDVDYYKLELADGADYLIDLGSDGTLELTGNLSVSGNVTQTEVNEIVVTDNTIRLNNGETGIGVTAGTSGIEIDRGVADDAEFVFDESLFTLRDGAQFAGAFVARTANSNPLSIYAAGLSGFAGDDIYIKPDNGTVKISDISKLPTKFCCFVINPTYGCTSILCLEIKYGRFPRGTTSDLLRLISSKDSRRAVSYRVSSPSSHFPPG